MVQLTTTLREFLHTVQILVTWAIRETWRGKWMLVILIVVGLVVYIIFSDRYYEQIATLAVMPATTDDNPVEAQELLDWTIVINDYIRGQSHLELPRAYIACNLKETMAERVSLLVPEKLQVIQHHSTIEIIATTNSVLSSECLENHFSTSIIEAVNGYLLPNVGLVILSSRPGRDPTTIALEQARPWYIWALLAAWSVTLIIRSFDQTLWDINQVEEVSQMAIVGHIPTAKEPLYIAHIHSGHYPQIESFRRLRTNILAAGDTNASKILLLTSPKRGEGKTTIAANLAVAIAQSGYDVVVVECDLRLPTVHRLFDLPNKHGLTNVLVGEVTLDEVMQYTTFPRVRAITSGPLPPNPTELLGSRQMLETLQVLKGKFNFVILDTPALVSVTDAAVLASAADNVLLVISQGYTSRSDVLAVRQQMSNVHVRSMEVVVNRVKSADWSYYIRVE